MQVLALIILIAFLFVGVSVLGITMSLAYYLISGLIVGALARLVLPGRENIGLFGTALVGVAGGMAGGVLAGVMGLGQLLQLTLSVAAAALLLSVLGYREQRQR